MTTDITEFLFPAPATARTAPAIIRWWESRRLGYNLIVGGCGLVSLGVVRIMTWLPPGDPEMPPVAIAIVFGVLANLCYLLGPTVEIGLEKLWGRRALPAGPTLFRMGLTFSVGLALLPTLIAGLDWGFRVLRTIIW